MSKAIWKFQLQFHTDNVVKMPADAKVLHAHAQKTTPCIWALVDPGQPLVERRFMVVPTGENVRDLGVATYIGSCHFADGDFVFHVFEAAS